MVNSVSHVVNSVSDVVSDVVNSVSNVVSSVSDVVIYLVNSVSHVVNSVSDVVSVMVNKVSYVVNLVNDVVNSVSDVGPADQSVNSTTVSLVPPGQCECSWHGGSRREEHAASPSSSRHPVFVLTVEFAGDSIEEDVTTANNEGIHDSCLSTEEPETAQTFLKV